ncbi:MAG TPA: hypothetical protein VFM34_03120 [Moraxellaceae bacterium]|nr:hypothetical protein [Moraxellaceae bacterium]
MDRCNLTYWSLAGNRTIVQKDAMSAFQALGNEFTQKLSRQMQFYKISNKMWKQWEKLFARSRKLVKRKKSAA